MHLMLVRFAFGWLVLGGVTHLAVDVVSQYLRGARVPGPETSLYYGLNTGFALGQILFGLLGLLVAQHSVKVFSQLSTKALSLVAAIAWISFSFAFLEYWEPRIVASVFGALVIAAIASSA